MAGLETVRRFAEEIVYSPINLALVGLIVYFTYKLFRRDDSAASNAKKSDALPKPLAKLPKRDYTLEELREFDGVKSGGRLLIGVLGRVFDVSRAHQFYGPGGPYSVFSGRDASRALAAFSVDPAMFKDTYDDLSDLKPSEMENVREWEMQFLEKYDVVGKLLKPGDEPTNYNDNETSSTSSQDNKKDH